MSTHKFSFQVDCLETFDTIYMLLGSKIDTALARHIERTVAEARHTIVSELGSTREVLMNKVAPTDILGGIPRTTIGDNLYEEHAFLPDHQKMLVQRTT